MLKRLILLCTIVCCVLGNCPRVPSIYHSRFDKSSGDNGYNIKINENPAKYVPGKLYTLYLMGSKTLDKIQQFQRFIVNVESTEHPENISPQNVGSFQLYGDNYTTFNEECVNTVSEKSPSPKTEVYFMWSAPPPGSGCVTFRAMVLENAENWFADEGGLSKTFCEQTDKDIKFNEDDCCACEEAKYSLTFEGIWSSKTHPKDYPTNLWLTHFSDVIGASHEKNFTFWGEGQIASEGFRSLAEWGSVRMMEIELRAKAQYLKTIIKASGLWYPNVNTNTSTSFKVDRKRHLISVASMFGPSPDWVVGVNGLNLCLKNCSWIPEMIINLFPYDAGTDGGITYNALNVETNPREKMYRITTTYPEDPRAPFYDPTKTEMEPLAKLHLKREKIIPKPCDENFLNSQLDVSENTEDTSRPECAVTEYTDWSKCSVTCGKGLRMRTREYRIPQKATMFGCNRQLISKEMCVAAVPECEQTNANESAEEIVPIESLDAAPGGVCSTSPWGSWSTCSETCGVGFKMRNRYFLDTMGMKKCPHITIVEKEKCMGPPCTAQAPEVKDPMCPTTEWSDWSPCSASCGKGVKFRQRLFLVMPELQQKCHGRVEFIQQAPCMDTPDCTFDMSVAKVVCMQQSDTGPCQGYYSRWSFDASKLTCVQFAYGGCRGNQNNFLTYEECMSTCSVVKDALSGKQPTIPGSQPIPSSPISEAIDCMVTPWSSWSRCSVTCGTGVEERFRMVKREPQNGGKACPTNMKKKRRCYGPVPCYQ